MSLRAELIRFCLPWFMRPRSRADIQIEDVRREVAGFAHLVPPPPRGTELIVVDAGGVKAERIATPRSLPNRYVLHLHGGAYLLGFPALFRDFTWRIADAAGARVLCLDYRLAPEHPFPAAIEDVIAAYRWLISECAEPRHVAFIGDSSGGGLALASMMRLRDEGLPLPAAAVALSPWTDLALTGQSLTEYGSSDPMVPVELMPKAVELYLAGADPRSPYASPLYGDPTGLPSTLIFVGSDEALRDDAMRMAERLRAADRDVELEVWPRMFHVWPMFARILPEGRAAIARIGAFLRSKL
ncbi:alpha/beta hydrolase [Methylocystis hirsuta]|uniref:Alpha/beta hydrolase n=1 Tax=Methylocystis hirsuta TaxID=369798 RepID=A0A3M9XML7_9HYPH|nr:alpha/beta hydrolase [Methylocystis hirsuta]RNJ48120.1 alpha/beta hydrolase [Methylocystis hirsuta]